LAVLAIFGSGAVEPARAESEVFGGFRFAFYQSPDTGEVRFRVGPSFQLSYGDVRAGSLLEFEVSEEGSLTQILVSPEVGYELSPTRLKWSPGFRIDRREPEAWIALSRTDGLLPRFGDFGAAQIESLLRRFRAQKPSPERALVEEADVFWVALRNALRARDRSVSTSIDRLPSDLSAPVRSVTERRQAPEPLGPSAIRLGADLELKLEPQFAPVDGASPAR
jgi:hypothetical protein